MFSAKEWFLNLDAGVFWLLMRAFHHSDHYWAPRQCSSSCSLDVFSSLCTGYHRLGEIILLPERVVVYVAY